MTRLVLPFGPAATGRAASVEDGSDDHVRQMLEQVVMTIPGERVMRPIFGSPVTQMLFAPADAAIAHALQASLTAAIGLFLGDLLDLIDLTVDFSDTDSALEIVITYQVRRSKTAAPQLRLRKDRS
jgi:phage baseplate assembly protein W